MKISCIVLLLALGVYARVDDIAKLEETHFGKMLLRTVAVQLSVSNDRVDEVVDILEELKKTIQREQEDHDRSHEEAQIRFQESIDKYNSIIDNAQIDYDDAISKISEFTPKRDQAEQDLKNERIRLQGLKDEKKRQIEKREQEHQQFLDRQKEFDDSIGAAQRAIELVSQLSTENSSFLQMPVLVQIVKDLPAVRSVAPSYAALLRVLVQLSTSKHANSETVAKCLKLIGDLKAKLEANKQQAIDDEETAQENHDEYIRQLNLSIDDSSAKITELETDYANYKQIVSDNELKRDTSLRTIEDNTKLRDDVIKQKEDEQENYDKETARRNKEISIVDEAVTLLEERLGDMSEYVGKRISE